MVPSGENTLFELLKFVPRTPEALAHTRMLVQRNALAVHGADHRDVAAFGARGVAMLAVGWLEDWAFVGTRFERAVAAAAAATFEIYSRHNARWGAPLCEYLGHFDRCAKPAGRREVITKPDIMPTEPDLSGLSTDARRHHFWMCKRHRMWVCSHPNCSVPPVGECGLRGEIWCDRAVCLKHIHSGCGHDGHHPGGDWR